MPASLAIATEVANPVPVVSDDEPEPNQLRRVLAFVRGWSIDREPPEELAAMRARLKRLHADLTILADGGVWSFDDDASYSDRACGDMARTALLLGVKTRDDTVYVIDGQRVSRYPLATTDALGSTLAAALAPTPRPEKL